MLKVVPLVLVLLTGTMPASAATITLEFDSAATGSGIISGPLVTSLGTITATNAELVIFSDDLEFNAAGASGNKIDHQAARLLFDFDVHSISLVYGGNFGDITIRVGDASNTPRWTISPSQQPRQFQNRRPWRCSVSLCSALAGAPAPATGRRADRDCPPRSLPASSRTTSKAQSTHCGSVGGQTPASGC